MSAPGLVVVGASLAGLRAVEGARRSGYDGPVTLIGAESHLPYDRPPLSKAFLDGAELPPFRSGRVLREELGARLLLGTTASGLDTTARTVRTTGGDVPYDALVVATGATARRLPGSGHLRGVHVLRTRDDAEAIRAALDSGARTVVIGAGFIGSEVASAAHRRGLSVTVVEALPVPLVRAVGESMGEACAGLHRRNGMDLRCGTTVAALEGEGSVEAVRLDDGTLLPADLVVVGVGADPATGWLEGSGLTLDNGIVCDEKLFTGVPGVYAAGDVARWHNPVFGRSMRLEHWTSAAEQGAAAARNALDPAGAEPYGCVPYFWSDWYDTRIQFLGAVAGDEIRVVGGDVAAGRFVALYREGGRLSGVLTMNGRAEIMKYRGLILRGASWEEALMFAGRRGFAAGVAA